MFSSWQSVRRLVVATTWCLRDYSEPILWQFSKHFLFRYTNEHILCIYHIDDIYIYIIHTSYWWYMMVMNPGQKGGILYPQHQDIFDVDQLLRSIVCHGPRWYKVENLVLDVPAPKNGVLAQKQGGKLSVHGVVHGIRRWWDFCRICRRQTLEPVDTP